MSALRDVGLPIVVSLILFVALLHQIWARHTDKIEAVEVAAEKWIACYHQEIDLGACEIKLEAVCDSTTRAEWHCEPKVDDGKH